ncbi:DUF5695 domain-containing protein, partial [Acetobacter malorum]|uniref:DUF5695 domain-containing protein n=1 Tax=Acetobacter malorum TaxID=178901 RepID=UPI0039EADE12
MRRRFLGETGGTVTVFARLSCVSVLTALGAVMLPLEAFAQAGASGLEGASMARCSAEDGMNLCAAGPFALRFYGADGTLRSLAASSDKEADYLPWRLDGRRQGNGFAHLGDIDFRLKSAGSPRWKDFSSWHAKRPVRELPAEGNVLRQDEITPSLGAGFPLRVRRVWRLAGQGLVLEFSVANPGRQSVQVGGMGFPLVFGNDFTDETLDDAHKHEVFVDPAIARDGGYIQVTRMSGAGPVLLGMPEGRTPLEVYRPLVEAPAGSAGKADVLAEATPRSQTFEGFYDWMPASAGFADQEWQKAGSQWNAPTQFTLKPGETRTFGVRFAFAPNVRGIEQTLATHARPVAVSLPGYVVPEDLPATLYLHSAQAVRSFSVEPKGALNVSPEGAHGVWQRYRVGGKTWG